MSGFSNQSFSVLAELQANNTKEWYDANKDRLVTHVRAPFAAMLGITTALLEGSSLPMIGSDKTMFRQNRDVRFSKDKTLYKTNVSGMLTPSGVKGGLAGLVYAQLGPEGGFLAAGYYQLSTPQLNLVRDQILANPARFTEITDALAVKGLVLSSEGSLKTMPRGYTQHADHELADALRLKRYVVSTPQPKEVWLNGDIVEHIVAMAEAIAPLLRFGRDALSKQAS